MLRNKYNVMPTNIGAIASRKMYFFMVIFQIVIYLYINAFDLQKHIDIVIISHNNILKVV
ncbi:hypothetical protein wCauATS_15120 [Wolbachia pipientis]